MQIKRISWLLIAIAVAIVPLFYAGCATSPGGAAAPAPPVEIPSPVVLKFVEPSDLAIGVNEFAGISTTKALGSDRSDEIGFALGFKNDVQNIFIDATLTGISEVEVPFSVSTTTYRVTKLFSRETGFLSGTKQIKIDFADFDLDNDGVTEGCSGNSTPYTTEEEFAAADPAAAKPICARVWIDGVRFLAWVFDQYYVDPTIADVAAKNVGAGRFKVFVDDFATFSSAFSYNHIDPEAKFTELFLEGLYNEGAGVSDTLAVHMLDEQDGPNDLAIVTSNMNVQTVEGGPGGAAYEVLYLERYVFLEGSVPPHAAYWAGSFAEDIFPAAYDNFDDECVQLSTGLVVENSFCADVDVDGDLIGDGFDITGVFDLPFIDALVFGDITVPADFPATPTFL